MPTFSKALAAIFLILGVHGVAIALGWYDTYVWFDIPMHFSGGCAIGCLALAGWNFVFESVTFRKSLHPGWRLLAYALAIIGFVTLIGVAWEWYEFLFDQMAIFASAGLQPAQMGLADTMADLFFDVLGAVLAFTLFRNRALK